MIHPSNLERPQILDLAPPPPRSVEETGLGLGFLTDLALRFLYQEGLLTGVDLSSKMGLPFPNVLENVIDFLAKEKYVDMRGGKGFGRVSFDYVLTDRGREVAKEALERSAYVGFAPVPLERYASITRTQVQDMPPAGMERIKEAFKNFVFPEEFFNQVGPAINSSRSLFLHGPSGNGKTSVAERIGSLLAGEVFVPHAVEVDGQVIKVFDPLAHREVEAEVLAEDTVRTGKSRPPGASKSAKEIDRRWLLSKRPLVEVGGELTLETLDLVYNERRRFYEAPFQMKANGGLMILDDFGRQRVHPRDLLNRWIVPLEKRVDFLTLHTGKKFEVPFEQLIFFVTNLDPRELVDEAFLRRIKYKVEIPNPTEESYRSIFRMAATAQGIRYSDDVVTYIIDAYYKPFDRELRSCHPRDIVGLVVDIARFKRVRPALDPDLVDQACRSFFVTI
jgi:hypothetical protein